MVPKIMAIKGARRQVQGGALAPPWILLYKIFYSHFYSFVKCSVWHYSCRESCYRPNLFSAERNTTAGVLVPQVFSARQIYTLSLEHYRQASGFAPPCKRPCGRPWYQRVYAF